MEKLRNFKLLLNLAIALVLIFVYSSKIYSGPVLLSGLDVETGKRIDPNNSDPEISYNTHGSIHMWGNIILHRILNNVSGTQNKILVFCGTNNSSDDVNDFWNKIITYINYQTGSSYTIDFFAGVSGITNANISISVYKMIVVSSYMNGYFPPSGALLTDDFNAVCSRNAEINNFVSDGGGLIGFTSVDPPGGNSAYGYISLGSPVIQILPQNATDFWNLKANSDGINAGFEPATHIDIANPSVLYSIKGPGHVTFSQYPSFLTPLVLTNDIGGYDLYKTKPIILGGNYKISPDCRCDYPKTPVEIKVTNASGVSMIFPQMGYYNHTNLNPMLNFIGFEYFCNPAGIPSIGKWEVYDNSSGNLIVGPVNGVNFNYNVPAGSFIIKYFCYCCNDMCDSNSVVVSRGTCLCNSWFVSRPIKINRQNGTTVNKYKSDSYTFSSNPLSIKKIKANGYVCSNSSSCPVYYSWEIKNNSGIILKIGNGSEINYSTDLAGVTLPSKYKVYFYPYCGGYRCNDPCILKVKRN
jgi:hypothetical protein